MKKSFFVGFLATVAFADSDWTPTYYKPTSKPTPPPPTHPTPPVYPSVNPNVLFPLSGTSYGSYVDATNQAIDNAVGETAIADRSIDSLFLRLPSSK